LFWWNGKWKCKSRGEKKKIFFCTRNGREEREWDLGKEHRRGTVPGPFSLRIYRQPLPAVRSTSDKNMLYLFGKPKSKRGSSPSRAADSNKRQMIHIETKNPTGLTRDCHTSSSCHILDLTLCDLPPGSWIKNELFYLFPTIIQMNSTMSCFLVMLLEDCGFFLSIFFIWTVPSPAFLSVSFWGQWQWRNEEEGKHYV